MADRSHTPDGAPAVWIKAAVHDRPRDACWMDWPYAIQPSGYPVADHGNPGTHIALEADGRPRPPAPNDYALHSCDVRICLNPDHLRWGSHLANLEDMMQRGRATGGSMPGEINPAARLSEEQVNRIRSLYGKGGGSQRALARRFGVSQSTIGKIVRRAIWSHLD